MEKKKIEVKPELLRKRNELAKRYFWDYKLKELLAFIIVALFIFVICPIVGYLNYSLNFMKFSEEYGTGYAYLGYTGFIILLCLSAIIGIIWFIIYSIIESNKQMAREKANKELGIEEKEEEEDYY